MKEVASNPLDKARPMGFNLLRVPFFIEPDYPTDPEFEETNRVRLIRKWGGEAGWQAQKARHGLKERGQAVGIEKFNLDRVASNTLASHRVVQWVTRTLGVNKAEALYASLNQRHFVDGQKLNDRDMLIEAAASVGADREATAAFIDSDEGKPEIQRAQGRLQQLGVSGIPTLILGGKWQMPSGALGAGALVDAFRMVEEQGGAPGSLFAEDLSIPPHVMEETLDLATAPS
jgi:predicted DsbA family dithiol-disulfide isomerase